MVKGIMVLCISLIFFFLAAKIRSSLKRDTIKRKQYNRVLGTIAQVIYSDSGNVRYDVSFRDKGVQVLAQTDYYSSSTKSLNPGDEVEIGYYYIDGKIPRAVIHDDRIIPCANSVPGFCMFLTIIGAVLLVTALIMIVK
mgnify:FL=1